MKHPLLPPFLGIAATCVLLGSVSLRTDAAVIDLSKPVGDSITPTAVYWTFDEGAIDTSSAKAADHSGNGMDGVLTPSAGNTYPVYAPGKFGNGVHIVGNSATNLDQSVLWDGRTNKLDASKIDFAGKDFTVGLWLKLNSINTGAAQTISLLERGLSVFPGTTGTQRNFLAFRLEKGTSDKWTLSLMLGDAVHGSINVVSDLTFTTVNDLEWHHFAFTLKPTETGSLVQFYMDGETLGSEKFVEMLVAPLANPSEKELRLGERNASNYYSAFDGVIDDFFMTEGAHTFMVPEPSAVALLPFAGLGLLVARKRFGKR